MQENGIRKYLVSPCKIRKKFFGMPQGYQLDPLPFLTQINDEPQCGYKGK